MPVLAIPIAMTLGHPGLAANLKTPQLSPARFTNQVPVMDSTLERLLRSEGVSPGAPIVRIVDGRLMLPAWSDHSMSDKSWLPKPYEIIGSLPPARRQVYIERNARSGLGGWLVHHQADTIAHFDKALTELQREYRITGEKSSGKWFLWRFEAIKR